MQNKDGINKNNARGVMTAVSGGESGIVAIKLYHCLFLLNPVIMSKEIDDAKKILKSSKVILLIDWSGINVPRTLVNAGFTVFCHSPDGYTKAEIVNESLQPANSKNAFPPQDKEEGWLIFRPLENPPPPVDIVVVYRPENEHADIITNYVLPFDAKIFWLQYPITSAATELFARKHGLTFIEGYDIAAIANS